MINFALSAAVLYWFYKIAKEYSWAPKVPHNDKVIVIVVKPSSDFNDTELNWFKRRPNINTQIIDVGN